MGRKLKFWEREALYKKLGMVFHKRTQTEEQIHHARISQEMKYKAASKNKNHDNKGRGYY